MQPAYSASDLNRLQDQHADPQPRISSSLLKKVKSGSMPPHKWGKSNQQASEVTASAVTHVGVAERASSSLQPALSGHAQAKRLESKSSNSSDAFKVVSEQPAGDAAMQTLAQPSGKMAMRSQQLGQRLSNGVSAANAGDSDTVGKRLRLLPRLQWGPVMETLLTNSSAKVNALEQTGRQAVSVVLKAVPLLAKTTAKAAAARDQQGTRQRIGRERAAVSDLMAACEGLLLELSHMFALQGKRQTPAGQTARSQGRRVLSLLKDLEGARQQYNAVFHVTKLANRFMLIREPGDSPQADAKRLLESQGHLDPRNLCSVLRNVLGACNVMTDTWAALATLSAAELSEASASWPLLRELDILSAADVIVTLAGGQSSMSDAGGCSGPGSDGNEAPQASPSLTRPWWRASPSPSKRRQSHLRTAGSGLCMAARSLSATLDAAAGEAAGAEVADSGAAASAIAALDLDAIQHDRAAPPVQIKAMPKGGTYRGGIVDGEKSGLGQFEYRNGDRYEGQFARDEYNGFGVYSFANGGLYQGQWVGNRYSGLGVETFTTGSTYHGGYRDGQRHGWGACSFANGDYYEGQWDCGARHGRGMQQCPNHSSYVGDYKLGRRDGYGCFTWGSGDRYIGEFADDKPHGVGVYLFQSGQMYEGQWRAGSKHGWSIFSLHNGQQWPGQWAEGRPLWMQNMASADTAPSGSTAGTAEDVQKVMNAAAKARLAGTEGAARFSQHWEPEAELQGSVRRTVHQAVAAAETSTSVQEAALRAVVAAVKASRAAKDNKR